MRNSILLYTILSGLYFTASAHSSESNGMITVESPYDVSTTLNRLEKALRSKGMTIFQRVEHSKAAAERNIDLRDNELLIFGNPALGSLLMQCSPTAAIDLPLKALAYKDEKGRVWLSYNDPAYLADRHDAKGCAGVITKMSRALKKFTSIAVGQQ